MIIMITNAKTTASFCGRKPSIEATSPYTLAPMNIPTTTPSTENISVNAPWRRPETVAPTTMRNNTMSSIIEGIGYIYGFK